MEQSVPPLRILLVEDNRINQLVAVGFLSRSGHEVTLAENGRQALNLFEQGCFHLVFMDVQMPEMDGYEATLAMRAVEASAARQRTPIIALTAQALPEDRQRCLEAGMDYFLTKPIHRAELEEAVQFATQFQQA
jgi:CheY-like chemotaxis protein